MLCLRIGAVVAGIDQSNLVPVAGSAGDTPISQSYMRGHHGAQNLIFSEDFESETFEQWNIILGNWEIVEDNGSYTAHVTPATTHHRRIVSIASLADGLRIEALVKANSQGVDVGDVTVGFYGNTDGSECYHVSPGRGHGLGDRIAICRLSDDVSEELAANTDIVSVNEQWYNLVIQVHDGKITARRWEVGGVEPEEWQVTYSGATAFGGHLVLGLVQGWDAGEEAWFDDIAITPFACGDPNADELVDITDAVYLIAYIFNSGPEPVPYEAGDANCDDLVNVTDAVYLIQYIFSGGAPPCDTDNNGEPDC